MTAFIFAILALSGPYRECAVTSGKLTSCEATVFNGTAVVKHEGRFKKCKIGNGRV